MKRISELFGSFLLGVASLFMELKPASLCSVAVEELPDSMKDKR
jgi:hypothetical protein